MSNLIRIILHLRVFLGALKETATPLQRALLALASHLHLPIRVQPRKLNSKRNLLLREKESDGLQPNIAGLQPNISMATQRTRPRLKSGTSAPRGKRWPSTGGGARCRLARPRTLWDGSGWVSMERRWRRWVRWVRRWDAVDNPRSSGASQLSDLASSGFKTVLVGPRWFAQREVPLGSRGCEGRTPRTERRPQRLAGETRRSPCGGNPGCSFRLGEYPFLTIFPGSWTAIEFKFKLSYVILHLGSPNSSTSTEYDGPISQDEGDVDDDDLFFEVMHQRPGEAGGGMNLDSC